MHIILASEYNLKVNNIVPKKSPNYMINEKKQN